MSKRWPFAVRQLQLEVTWRPSSTDAIGRHDYLDLVAETRWTRELAMELQVDRAEAPAPPVLSLVDAVEERCLWVDDRRKFIGAHRPARRSAGWCGSATRRSTELTLVDGLTKGRECASTLALLNSLDERRRRTLDSTGSPMTALGVTVDGT